jgi:hypothetical protein
MNDDESYSANESSDFEQWEGEIEDDAAGVAIHNIVRDEVAFVDPLEVSAALMCDGFKDAARRAAKDVCDLTINEFAQAMAALGYVPIIMFAAPSNISGGAEGRERVADLISMCVNTGRRKRAERESQGGGAR